MSGFVPGQYPGRQGPPAMAPMAGAPADQGGNPTAEQLLAHLTGRDPVTGQTINQDPDGPQDDRKERSSPDVPAPRAQLVARWTARVKADKKHWKPAFDRMRANQKFAHGDQWPNDDYLAPTTQGERKYIANIALRHVQQRTASLYANNPTVVAKTRERMLAVVWDGDLATLQAAQTQLAQAAMTQAQQAQMTGIPVIPGQMPQGLGPHVLAIIADAKNVQTYNKMLKRVGKTLELLWAYNISEQTYPFKPMAKLTVRRAIVTGVGYFKLGFQRAMQRSPEIVAKIADMSQRLATIERLADGIADREIEHDGADAETLKLAIKGLMAEPEIIVREGLTFDYPDSNAIIPDKKTKSLRGFLGADWVTQEYMLSTDEIEEVYGIDVCSSYRAYAEDGSQASPTSGDGTGDLDPNTGTPSLAAVWEIYSRTDGLVYIVCDGYPDFLREPAPPQDYLDRFWPWFPVVLNEGYDEKGIYPPSDIDLLRDMQLELNRARQGLREHRKANRPKTIVAGGLLEESDKDKLRTHPANALIELNALAPGQKVDDVLQAHKPPPIDPALYDTNATFEDILRVLGQDQASMGQTTSSTATETAVAQSAQHTDLASVIDDQDDLLSELAQAGGKILLLNVSAATVTRVIGPGAIWPSLTKEDVVDNIYLQVEAGSTGRPNKQQEVMNAQVLFPMLQRVPGINPEWMARELIKRLDDRLDLTDAFIEGLPSMDAINRQSITQDPANPAAQAALAAGPSPMAPPAPPPGAGVPPGVPGGGPGGPGAPPPPGGPTGPAGPGGGAPPMAPPMGGGPNDPAAQGDNGGRNLPAPPPVNGLLGPRTPPVPGANGLMPGRGGGPRNTPQGALPVP